jgi:alpha-1,2-mannosyltransferase
MKVRGWMAADGALRWRAFLPAAVIIAALLATAMSLRGGKPGELPLYLATADRLVHGDEIYRLGDGELHAYSYPPFSALLLAPLAIEPARLQRASWLFAEWLCLLLAAALIWPGLAPRTRRHHALFLSLWVLVSLRVLLSPFSYLSHDLFVLVFLCGMVAAARQGSALGAGLLAGLAAAFKGPALLFLPLFLLRRRWLAAAAMAAAVIGATLLPDLLFPRQDGALAVVVWFRRIASYLAPGEAADRPGVWAAGDVLDLGPASTLQRLLPGAALVYGATLAFQLAILGWLGWLALATPRAAWGDPDADWHRLGLAAATMCAMLLLAPKVSITHYNLLLVPFGVCLADFLYRDRKDWAAGALLLAAFLLALPGSDLVGRSAEAWLKRHGAMTLATLALLAAVSRILCRPAEEAR